MCSLFGGSIEIPYILRGIYQGCLSRMGPMISGEGCTTTNIFGDHKHVVNSCLGRKCAIYDPNLLRDCTSLLIIVVRIGPKKWSSPVSWESRSPSKSSWNQKSFLLSRLSNGFHHLIACILTWIKNCSWVILVRRCLRFLSRKCAELFRAEGFLFIPKPSFDCLTMAVFLTRVISIRLGRLAEPGFDDDAYTLWLGVLYKNPYEV